MAKARRRAPSVTRRLTTSAFLEEADRSDRASLNLRTSAPTTLGDEVIQRQSLGKRAPDTDPIAARECIPGGDQPSEGTTMKHLLAAMAAFALMDGSSAGARHGPAPARPPLPLHQARMAPAPPRRNRAQGGTGMRPPSRTPINKARPVARRRTARPKPIRRAAAQRPARQQLPGLAALGWTSATKAVSARPWFISR